MEMEEGKKLEFTQKWIGDAVRKLLQKEDIYENDMERIKYLRIGEDFNCGFMIEISAETPPEPFCDTDGGDEWKTGGNGGTVTGRFLPLFIDYIKANPFDYVDSDTGKHYFQFSQFGFWREFKKEYNKSEDEEYHEDREDTVRKWKSFEKTILCETYEEEFDDDDAFDQWQRQVRRAIQKDIGLFTGVEVLRLQGAEYRDMTFLAAMPLLRVLEVVETDFVSMKGIDDLARLKQFCCWVD